MSINWIDWGEDAFSRARRPDKPLLLSLTATLVPRVPSHGRGDLG